MGVCLTGVCFFAIISARINGSKTDQSASGVGRDRMKKEIRGLLLMTLVCLAALMLSGCRMTDEVLDREMRAFNA